MGLPIIFSQALSTAANATAIVNAVGTSAAGVAFALVSTTVVLDIQRRVAFSVAGNESANTFTIVGLNQANNTVTDSVKGTNLGAFQSNLDFKTVLSVTPLSATSGTVTVGTNGVGSSLWQIINWNAAPINLGISVEARNGTSMSFTVDYTLDDPNNLIAGLPYPVPYTSLIVGTGFTTSNVTVGSISFPVTAVRLTTTGGTGQLWFRMLQAGISSPGT